MAELPLARDFPPADEAAWKKLVEKALSAPFASLESKSCDGIVIEPLYGRASDADVVPAGRGRRGRSSSASTSPTARRPTGKSSKT
nr:hypothetical protein [Methyloceanibacter marginalis]